ncbi:hypothetical protein AAZX31_11G114600 [Glycine max]|uniref:DUF241 domain-containing protein n=2 Tax=Glycine subgen. Soja TaxID=1462606 RepID=I1LJC1_SOYBN|nr:uncharacterized protein LOC100789159 [Glycine max]XP_003537868.1 uncharacterized protein LOC100789679 [Glycine max]XP_028189563.1 uncharacterized protein LOC114375902 [Glycine soja]XP_028189564.1 uncharacterized protein LOC114375903 [Glycine soja]KAG4988377.1 hypothetical protein JHK85_031360 [Glycine max]KAG4988378.1 hypothetical protein JHK85_031361 [Glycine max]KAG5123983.1 hypothetical protein JHK82_030720 [Glycine max]KAG5123984.1 hypothetical protein JHK82_030721 [Glycine max]KAG51|eukprot:XP_003537867.1 uncharacterized protein LOC100789159 [Glycine max]
MEASQSHFHVRSNSLPSRPHPLILQCNEHLDRLRSSNETSSSSSSLSHKLGGLQDLHECVEKLFHLSLSQEALHHECQENRVDELLNGSLRLLDVCTAAKDSLLHTKECMRELQSVMRRRKGGEVELKAEVKKFLISRKVVKKAISKALANLKGTRKNCNISSANKDNQLVSLLESVEVITLSTFQSLLQLISGTTQSKSNSWSLVSKLMQTKKVGCSQLADESEFAQLDEELQSCMFAQTSKFENTNNLQTQLEKVESLSQDLEEGLEFLFRRLIKTRVALLNILNH